MVMMGAGGLLVYAAVKGEHPWTMILEVLRTGTTSSSSSSTAPGTAGAQGAAAAQAAGQAIAANGSTTAPPVVSTGFPGSKYQ